MTSINDKITNITKTLMNQNVLMYGFVGITTAVLGYYTFFENDIETPPPPPQPEPYQPDPQQQFTQESIQQSIQQPMQSIQSYFSQPPPQQQPSVVGGKNKKKKTRRKQ